MTASHTKQYIVFRSLQRGRLAVVISIVGCGRTDLFAPTVLAVLACDWTNEWEPFKLLQVELSSCRFIFIFRALLVAIYEVRFISSDI